MTNASQNREKADRVSDELDIAIGELNATAVASIDAMREAVATCMPQDLWRGR